MPETLPLTKFGRYKPGLLPGQSGVAPASLSGADYLGSATLPDDPEAGAQSQMAMAPMPDPDPMPKPAPGPNAPTGPAAAIVQAPPPAPSGGPSASDRLKGLQPPAPPPSPKWYQKLAAAGLGAATGYVNAAGRAPIAPAATAAAEGNILAPGYAKKRAQFEQQRGDLEQQVKDQELQAGLEATIEQKNAIAEQRRAAAKTADQAEKDRAKAASDKIKELASKRNQQYVTDRLKGRAEDSTFQSADDPRLPNSEWIANPEDPSVGWAAPPSHRPATADLLPFLGGDVKVGDMITHSEYKQAVKDKNAKGLVDTKLDAKPDPNETLSPDVRTELKATGGDINKPADVAKAIDNIQQRKIQTSIASRPPRAEKSTTMMIPDGKGGYKATSISPGDTVPEGAVSAAGLNSLSVPTANTRGMAEKAPRVIQFVDRINQLLDENEKQLGPLKSRWNEFTAGRIGLPNRGYTQLRTDTGLLTTALMNMHVGSRGGGEIMQHFQALIDSARQDPDNLRAALGEIRDYAQRVGGEGGPKVSQQQPAPGGPPAGGKSYVQVKTDQNGQKWGWDGKSPQWEKVAP